MFRYVTIAERRLTERDGYCASVVEDRIRVVVADAAIAIGHQHRRIRGRNQSKVDVFVERMRDVDLQYDAFDGQRFRKYEGAQDVAGIRNGFGHVCRCGDEQFFSRRTGVDHGGATKSAIAIHAIGFVIAVLVLSVIAIHLPGAPRTHEGPGHARRRSAARTRQSIAWISFVRHAVTVVVHAIAEFRLTQVVGPANERASHALLRSERANARHAGHACSAGSGVVFVDHAIAVVIEPVARFGGRPRDGITIHHIVLTSGHTHRADAHLSRRTGNARARNVVVDRAIAIVIDRIARLHGGHVHRVAGQHAHDAIAGPRRANAGNAGIAHFIFFGIRFVRELIAIVVEPVA